MAYEESTPWVKVGDVVLTNIGKEVELQARLIDDKPNPEFTKHRNASSRIWLKNGQKIRILVEVDNIVDKVHPLAVGVASCEAAESQSFYIRVRNEEPQASAPKDPSLKVMEIV